MDEMRLEGENSALTSDLVSAAARATSSAKETRLRDETTAWLKVVVESGTVASVESHSSP